jgi:hypothetical protein
MASFLCFCEKSGLVGWPNDPDSSRSLDLDQDFLKRERER